MSSYIFAIIFIQHNDFVSQVVSSEDASTEESAENSATEISTDSEFEHDEATPTQHEIPEITINDSYVRKTRGTYVEPKKVQIKSKMISSINSNIKQEKKQEDTSNEQLMKGNRIKYEPSKEVNCNVSASVDTNTRTPLLNPRKGDYLLNRTHSTGGIASRLSLELKKRYLLGGSVLSGSVVKSGSTSNVDTKLRNFTDAISQHQKLLNPAPEPSPTMQAFLQGIFIFLCYMFMFLYHTFLCKYNEGSFRGVLYKKQQGSLLYTKGIVECGHLQSIKSPVLLRKSLAIACLGTIVQLSTREKSSSLWNHIIIILSVEFSMAVSAIHPL